MKVTTKVDINVSFLCDPQGICASRAVMARHAENIEGSVTRKLRDHCAGKYNGPIPGFLDSSRSKRNGALVLKLYITAFYLYSIQ